jgi:hypothetical protein
MNSLFTHVPTYLCIHLYQQDKRQRLEPLNTGITCVGCLWQHATGNRVGCRIQVMAGCGTRCTSEKGSNFRRNGCLEVGLNKNNAKKNKR